MMKRFYIPLTAVALLLSLGAQAEPCDPADTSLSLPIPPNYEGYCNPGEGIMTGAWETERDGKRTWQGSATASWGEPGKLFAVDWVNQQSVSDTDHQEFDFSHKRDFRQGEAQGYGSVPLRDALKRDLKLTQTAEWKRAPQGKLHINAIIWLNEKELSESKADNASIDITISEWFHAGKEDFKEGMLPDGWSELEISPLTREQSDYHVYTRSGDVGEKASYLIIRDANRTTGTVDAGAFIKWLLEYENDNNQTFNENWYISSMGWEVTGQSAGYDKDIGNSSGKYEFSCYSIPSLNANQSGPGFQSCAADQPDSADGLVFSRTDTDELRWITADPSGQNGSIWISESCAESLGGPTEYGDWSDLMELAPGFDTVENPCR